MIKININKLKLSLSLIALYLAIFKDFVWLKFMPSPGKEHIVKVNFVSSLALGYGNILPIIFFVGLVISAILLLTRLFKVNADIYIKSIYLLEFIELIALVLPLLLGMQKINIGLVFMLIIVAVQVLINRLIRFVSE